MTSNRPPVANEGFAAGHFALVLGVFIVAAFPEVLLGWESFFYRDYGVLGYPFVYYLQESVRAFELPLWNPFSNCGAPFLAQWGPMVLYPFSLFYVLLPLPWSLGVFCLAHLFLGGLGMYFLARRWTGDRFAASVAGLAFAFNGVSLSCLMWPNYTVALGWMPWVIGWVEQGWREGGRPLWLAALVATFQMLSGVPEVILLTWGLLSAMLLGQLWSNSLSRAWLCARFALLIALVAGLSAAQLLPFFDLLSHSQRGASFATAKWAMPAWGWANLLAPMFHYFMTPQRTFFQAGQEFMTSYYLGSGVLALAILAAWLCRNRRVWLLSTTAAVALLLALGDNGPLYPWLKGVIPLLGLARYPIKFVILSAFAFPLLAAYAVGALQGLSGSWRAREWRPVWFTGIILIALMAGIVWTAFNHPLTYDQPGLTRLNTTWRALGLGLVLGLCLGCASATELRFKRVCQLGMLLTIGLDALTHLPRLTPTISSGAFTPNAVRDLVQFTPPVGHGVGRVMISPGAEQVLNYSGEPDLQKQFLGRRRALWSNLNLLDGIPKVNGSSTLQLREQAEVQSLLYGPRGTNLFGVMDFLNVAHTTAPQSALEWQARSNALPLVSIGQAPRFADGPATLRALAEPAFNPREVVYLPLEARSSLAAERVPDAQVLSSRFTAQQVDVEVQSRRPALLVVAQSYYHRWQATVDGVPAPLWRANHAFQAVAVPAGRHHVTLAYRDPMFGCGAAISGLTLLGCAAGWVRLRKGRRNTGGGQGTEGKQTAGLT